MPYLFSKIRNFFILIPGIALILSCSDREEFIPYVPVFKIIYLSDPDFINLLPVGNSVVLPNEGYGGIIVYHKSEFEFQAFDRTCTWEADPGCLAVDQGDLGLVSCTCCESEYYLILDGMVKQGPARRPLKQYQVSYDGEKLIITN